MSGPVTESGSVLISHPMVPEITGVDLPVTVTAAPSAPDAINPGDLLHVTTEVELDLSTIADDVLEHRVKPGVVAVGFPNLAPFGMGGARPPRRDLRGRAPRRNRTGRQPPRHLTGIGGLGELDRRRRAPPPRPPPGRHA